MGMHALLALADGTIFEGIAIGEQGVAVGEVVFNTAMTGYQEILTDPSYSKQIVTFTHPHIGNTGVNLADQESTKIHAQGLIIHDLPRYTSNFRSTQTLTDFLRSQKVVGIADVDTRALTRLLREKGAQNGCIMVGENIDPEHAVQLAREFSGLAGVDLAKMVSTTKSYSWTQGSWTLEDGLPVAQAQDALPYHVVAYDFGIKQNILRMLVDRGCHVTVVPATTPASEVLSLKPDGLFFSNGPGDPAACTYAIDACKQLLEKYIPIFGICLGHQILALAAGAQTRKMKFGHHGANHPVKDLKRQQVLITSQNHGFAVDEQSLPANVRATHVSLFDGSLQGIALTDRPAFSFQGHPEASPGPHDAAPLFDEFIELIKQFRA
ncbi:MAG: glutamine-hydrolyzing carbamoyl-phosphate synthase small subunit [Vibrionaceae bacterium]